MSRYTIVRGERLEFPVAAPPGDEPTAVLTREEVDEALARANQVADEYERTHGDFARRVRIAT